MHQFGHIYALQQEMTRTDISWFRAMELWHTSRHEGIPYATKNYAHLLRFCNRDSQWEQAFVIFRQMRASAVSVNVSCVHNILVAAVKGGQWKRCLAAYDHFKSRDGILYDEMCYLAAVRAAQQGGQWQTAMCVLEEGSRMQSLPLVSREVCDLLTERGLLEERERVEVFVSLPRKSHHPNEMCLPLPPLSGQERK